MDIVYDIERIDLSIYYDNYSSQRTNLTQTPHFLVIDTTSGLIQCQGKAEHSSNL